MMTKTKRNLVLIFMCALLVATAIAPVSANRGQSGTTAARDAVVSDKDYSYMPVPDGYEEVCSNEYLSLSADLKEKTGYFILKNLKNNYIWYSNPQTLKYDGIQSGAEEERFCQSQIIVGYVFKQDEIESSRVFYFETENRTVDVKKISNGIRVTYSYKQEAEADEEGNITKWTTAVIPVDFVLENDHFSAKIDISKVKYTDDIIITSINVLPYFGAGLWTDKGQIFIPDGSGALIDFDKHKSSVSTDANYEEYVYGEDMSIVNTDIKSLNTETIRMPVFGLINGNDNALMGVIDEGAETASILASPSTSDKVYNTTSAKTNIRLTSFTKMFAGRGSNAEQEIFRLSENPTDFKSFKVDYYVLDGKDANYVGMANTYRKYLLDNKLINTDKVAKPTLNVDIYGAVDVKANAMGITYRKLKALTTYEQASEIIKALKSKGIKDLSVRYKGWANNGITNKGISKSADLIGVLGGKKGYQSFADYAKQNKVKVYNDVELSTFTNGKQKFAAKNAFSEVYKRYQYLRSVYAYDLNGFAKMMINPKYLVEFSQKYFNSVNKYTNNVSVSDLTQNVYSHLKRGELQYRTKYVSETKKVLSNAQKQNINLAGERANAYAFKYTDKIYMAPIYSSGYNMIDSEVPFYQIVLHGYITMTGEPMVQSTDSQVTFLKCVESGTELLWSGIYENSEILSDTNYDDLYGSNYKLWMSDAVEKYNAYQPLLNEIYDQTIVDHYEVADEVTVTEYSNGVKVYVNYNNKEVSIDGLAETIQPKGFMYELKGELVNPLKKADKEVK